MSVRCIFLAFSVVVVVVCFFLPSSVAIFNYYCQKTLVFVATAHARVAIMLSFLVRWIESILRGLSETFGPRSIFSAHDNAGSKFDKHPISIDFTGYKTQTNLLFRAFLSLNLVVRLCVKYINTSVTSGFTDHLQ